MTLRPCRCLVLQGPLPVVLPRPHPTPNLQFVQHVHILETIAGLRSWPKVCAGRVLDRPLQVLLAKDTGKQVPKSQLPKSVDLREVVGDVWKYRMSGLGSSLLGLHWVLE